MSNQVGRNAPCPCGSGKKYKRCCGKKDAVSITSLVEKDAANLHKQIIDYAVSEFADELSKDFQKKLEYLVIKDKQRELELYVLAHTIWFIFFKALEDGSTVIERFIRERGKNIVRPRLQEIAKTWTKARPVAGPVLSVDGERMQIRDALTEEVIDIKLLESSRVPKQTYAIAVVLPFGQENIFFWEPFDYNSPLKGNEERFLKSEFAKSKFDDPVKFLAEEFLIIMNQLPFYALHLGAEQFTWEKPSHKETAELLEKGLAEDETAYESMITAFALWNSYCKKKPDQRRKAATNAAAIHYLLLDLNPNEKPTKKEVAAIYDVSPSALTNALNDITETIADEIEQFRTAIDEDMTAESEAAAAKD